MIAYAELWCQTAFSFQEGASLPEDLVARARALGLSALEICDRGAYGLLRAWRASQAAALPLPHGALLRFDGLPELALYAADGAGWSNLCELLSRARVDRGATAPPLADLLARPGGLIALADADWALHPGSLGPLADALGDRLYVAAARQLTRRDGARVARAAAAARRVGRPVVAVNRVLYDASKRQRVQDALTCLREKVTLAAAGDRLEPNAERRLKSPDEMAALFPDRLEWVARSAEVAGRCGFHLGALTYDFPADLVPAGETAERCLRRAVAAGVRCKSGE